ncbi:MAG: Ig-like domain-containing protein [Propionibacteriaceae bacterium]
MGTMGGGDQVESGLGARELERRERGSMPFSGTRPLKALRRTWSAVVVGVVALAVAVGALAAPGFPAADLRLHDASVFVVNRSAQLLGKFNDEIDELASSTAMANKDFDVLQDEKQVIIRDLVTNTFQQVDSGSMLLGTPATLPGDASLSIAESTVAVGDPATGGMWARSMDEAFGVDYAKTKPDVDLGPGGQVVLASDGTPYGVSVARSEIVRIEPDGTTEAEDLPFDLSGSDVQLSVVGDRPVVLDRAQGLVWVSGDEPVSIDGGESAELQAPSATGLRDGDSTAVVATPTGLFGVGNGRATELAPAQGQPSEPVVVGGCFFGAWHAGVAGTVAQGCGEGVAEVDDIPEFDPGAELVFRVNRDVVVLNDLVSGNVWLPQDNMELISDWTHVAPPEPKEGEESDDEDVVEEVDPNRSAENRPPVAEDDAVAVRDGRATLLPLLDNDSDPDGDILTFTGDWTVSGANATVSAVRGGSALQIDVPEGEGGRVSFGYTVDDGRGGKDQARVSVNVLTGTEVNSPPEQEKREPVVLPQNGKAEKRVLLDWRDPEGDDLLLVGAEAPGEDEVTWTPDGQLSYIDSGLETGRKEIAVQVSDGQATTEGVVVVDVRKSGSIPPKANGDFTSAAVGEEVVVEPLANDEGEELMLARVSPEKGGEVAPNYDDNTFTFRATSPGTYYVGYVASNGPTDFGLVRIDVREESEDNRAPVAARDLALLPAGGSVLVDPLANDEDADNDVLVLQSVDPPPGVEVRQVQRHLLEISAESTPDGPISFGYTVSDGLSSDQGTVVVLPVSANDNTRPVAVDDEVTVRAGDASTVRVLENDSSPVGLPLEVDSELPEGAGGAAWVDGEYVRFRAPDQPGEHRVVYQIRDSQGQVASAAVRFNVISPEVENTPPEPRPETGRVLAGTNAKLVIDLRGIDPEGDTVRLAGIDTGPSLGRVTSVGEGWLQYEAYPDSAGTDTFRYRVVDSHGAEGIAEIRVGVVPRAEGNTPPTTVDDSVVARPGRTVRVPALDNDSDPDGDAFGFDADALDFGDTEARLVDDVIEFTVPEETGTSYGAYGVVDARGAEAVGRVKVTSDPEAPLLAPVPHDDLLTPLDVAGKDWVEVPVLDNDFDPDGNISEATVSLPDVDPEAKGDQPRVEGDQVIAPVTDRMQVLRYRLSDVDEQAAWALITIPGRADAGPALKADVKPQEVLAGEPLELEVNDHVIGADGGRVQLTSEDRVWASRGAGEASSKTELEFVAPLEYAGPASISFEVTDGSDADDAEGRTAVLTIPITVLPNPKAVEEANQPPEANSVTLTVGAGEEGNAIDLAKAVRDPEGEELSFGAPAGDLPGGVQADLEGSVLTATADAGVEPGTTATLTSTVGDGVNEVDLTIEVQVRASSRPLPQAADDSVPDAVQGRETVVPVLANDLNPFPDEPLTVVRTSLESGAGNVEVRGDSIAITPAENTVGTMVVRYVVRDATDSADRESEARVRLTVKGRPDQPGTARRGEVGNQEAVITWTAPEDNGSPITGYTVTATGSQGTDVNQTCASTTCTITNLVNNESYRFRVVATNAIGDSDPSAASAEIRPDVRPGKPAAPSGKFGDGEITFRWTPPTNEGSPINGYDLQLQGPEGVRNKSVGNVTTTTWGGLQNGSSYVLRIRAKNKAPEPSDWSARSKSVVPAGPPSAPRNVAVKDAKPSDPTGGALTLSWQQPARNNGDAIDSYRIYQNGSFLTTAGAGARSKTLKVKNGTAYRYTMEAVNKAGRGDRSATTPAFTPYGAPKPPTSVSLTPGNKRVTVKYSGASSRGAKIDKYTVRIGKARYSVRSGGTITGLKNGNSYSADVQACSKSKCGSFSKQSNTVVPYGPPNQPTVSNARIGAKKVKFSWKAPTKSNGRAVTGVQVRVRKGSGSWSGWSTKGRSGSIERGTAYDQTWSLQARTVNSEGQKSSAAQTSRKTDDKPKPTVTVHPGADRGSASGCSSGHCWDMIADVTGFPANTTVKCTSDLVGNSGSKTTNGKGNASGIGDMGFAGQRVETRVVCEGGGVTQDGEAKDWPKK